MADAPLTGWQLLKTAPDGQRVLLGPRYAPVVGIVRKMPFWADEQDPVASVTHYNGTVLVERYHCREWHPLPDGAAAQPQPQPAQPLTGAGEVLALLREMFTLQEMPQVWHGSTSHRLSFSGSVEYRCSDCDENAWSHAEIVHNKGCSYFAHMERIARSNKTRARLQELAGITAPSTPTPPEVAP